jgi:hypothetical protein
MMINVKLPCDDERFFLVDSGISFSSFVSLESFVSSKRVAVLFAREESNATTSASSVFTGLIIRSKSCGYTQWLVLTHI